MNRQPDQPDRLDVLLVDDALYGLSDAERAELDALFDGGTGSEADRIDLREIVAMAQIGMTELEPMPSALHDRVRADAVAHLAAAHGLSLGAGPDVDEVQAAGRSGSSMRMLWPWLLAAACLALVLVAWWPTPAPASLYASLTSDTNVLRTSWNDPDGVITGEVVWSDERQTGVLKVSGLPRNDPRLSQYQLWIFDAARTSLQTDSGDTFEAVDGGVFDIDRDGTVYVKIDAKLPVGQPSLFAITREPPGGVVKHITDVKKGYGIIVAAAGVTTS